MNVNVKSLMVSQLSALGDDHVQLWGVVRSCWDMLDSPKALKATLPENLSKHHVLAVQPICLGARDEKLAAIRVATAVRETQQTGLCVFKKKGLIVKLGSVDAVRTSAVALDKVSTLDHKLLNAPVKGAIFISLGNIASQMFSSAKLSEVFARAWSHRIATALGVLVVKLCGRHRRSLSRGIARKKSRDEQKDRQRQENRKSGEPPQILMQLESSSE